jgi:1,2-diacylglycerol 3-beta-glucosyltransferase
VRDLYGVVVALLMSFGLAYFFLAMVLGTWAERKTKRAYETTGDVEPEVDAVFVLVPCRDEESVIERTIHALLAQDTRAMVVVIDDGSEDATAAIVDRVRELDPSRVHLVRRFAPNARKGKGLALNSGFQMIRSVVEDRSLDPARVVICVMDADGRLSDGAIQRVLPTFNEPQVGGVQLPVEIRNQTNLVAKMVHFEFWGYSAISQFGRTLSRTVSLGGNGQFTRMSALLEMGIEPWSTSLTEDLDLSVSLAVRGWQMQMVSGAAVNQQAVTSVRKYVRQRSRWFQGHMTTSFRIGEVWRSRSLSNAAMLELVSYLMLPFALVLPWSILGQIALYDFVRWLSLPSFREASSEVRVLLFAFAYLMSFLPNLVLATLYFRRDEKASLLRAIGLAHLMLAFNYLSYIAAWIAVYRMLRGATSWDKTGRAAETAEPPLSTNASVLSVGVASAMSTPTEWKVGALDA